MKKEFLTTSPAQTQKIGKNLAKKILKIRPGKKAYTIGLVGDLGGGKTTFLQGFAKGLGIKEKILSPTFVILKKFKIKHRASNFGQFYHVDCYRIKKPKEVLNLGFKEIILNHQNIVAIEWADKIIRILPKGTILIKFHFVNKNTRKITFNTLKH